MLPESGTVVGPDGRTWAVRYTVYRPALYTGDEFEHDVSPRYGLWPGVLMVAAAWGALLYWFTPTGLLQLTVTTAAAVFLPLAYAARWFLRLPWLLVVETAGTDELAAEYWSAVVRGVSCAKEEMELVSRMIRATGSPEFFSSPFTIQT